MRVSLGFEPNPKQREFLLARARHVGYGGARGGGKSWAMRTKFVLLGERYPGLKLLLLRRTLPELRENHAVPLQRLLYGVAAYSSTERVFTFGNGSRIKLGYCDAESDVYQYQGQEYDVIGLEEATHFTETQMQFLTTCNRTVRPDFKPRMYYTMNPGNVGHEWVKRLFIDRRYRPGENPEDYIFIPARVYDNPVLLRSDPGYLQVLQALPDDLRRAHLFGDWDVLSGRYLPEFSRDTHCVAPFPIPSHWRRYRAFDYGLDMLYCLWAAAGEDGKLYVYREFYQSDLPVSAAAEAILARSYGERYEVTFAPFDLWGRSRESGRSQAELFAEAGLPLSMVKNGRVDSFLNLKEWLRGPRLFFFPNCPEIMRLLPLLQHDSRNPSDAATEPHGITHGPDALRYLLDGRPCSSDPLPEEEEEDFETQVRNFLRTGQR